MRLYALVTGLLLTCASGAFADVNPYSQTFTAFESGHVRPLAITPNRKFLLAVNTPDAKLEIFKITSDGLQHRVSVPVGLEPVESPVGQRQRRCARRCELPREAHANGGR